MRRFLPVFLTCLFFFGFSLFFLSSPVLAARYDIYFADGRFETRDVLPDPAREGNYSYFDNEDPSNKGCSGTYPTFDLVPCQRAGKTYSNTCCTTSGGCTLADGSRIDLWDWNYATGCQVTFYGVNNCNWEFSYATQTCGATDTCRAQPLLYPGLCESTGCVVSPTVYKTCCDPATGRMDGTCQGRDFTGTCPGGSITVICGVNPSVCAQVAPAPCTSAACGDSACAGPTPPPTPPPPSPSPPPPGCDDPPGGGNWRWKTEGVDGYVCTANQADCDSNACVGVPWTCDQETGNWNITNGSGECTTLCDGSCSGPPAGNVTLTSGCPAQLIANWDLGSGSGCNIYIRGGPTDHQISSDCQGLWSGSSFPDGEAIVNGGTYRLYASDGTTTSQSGEVTVNCGCPGCGGSMLCPVMHPYAQIRNLTKGQNFPSSVVYKGVTYDLSSPGACASKGTIECGLAVESTAQSIDADPGDILEMRMMVANENERSGAIHAVEVRFWGDKGITAYPNGLADDEKGNVSFCTSSYFNGLTNFANANIYCVSGGSMGCPWRWTATGEDRKSWEGETEQKWSQWVVSNGWSTARYQVAAEAVPGTTAGITAVTFPKSGVQTPSGLCFAEWNGSGYPQDFRWKTDDPMCPFTNDRFYDSLPLIVNIGQTSGARVDGPDEGVVGDTLPYMETFWGKYKSGSMYISKLVNGNIKTPFSCPVNALNPYNPATGNGLFRSSAGEYFCKLGERSTSPFSGNYQFTESGQYLVTVNAYENATAQFTGQSSSECSGNYFIDINPPIRRNQWADCGPDDNLTVTISGPPPTASLSLASGSDRTLTVGRGAVVDLEAEAQDADGDLRGIGVYRCLTTADCTRGTNWVEIPQASTSCSGVSCSKNLSWSTAGLSFGTYYLAVNAYDSDPADSFPADFYTGNWQTECSGNPVLPLPNSFWSDCDRVNIGANDLDYLTVTIAPPACSPPWLQLSPPPPSSLFQGDTKNLYAVTAPSYGTIDFVRFTSGDTSIVTVNPSQDNTPAYSTLVTAVLSGSPIDETTTVTADVYLNDLTGVNDGVKDCWADLDVTVQPVPPWFQTGGGDVYVGGDLSSRIPQNASPPYFSLDLPDSLHGIVSVGGDTADFLPGVVAQDPQWLMTEYPLGFTKENYGFDFFLREAPTRRELTSLENLDTGFYEVKTGGLVIPNDWTVDGGRKIVIYVGEGDLDIRGRVNVDPNSFLAFIVKEDINISGNVKAPAGTPAIAGIYLADGQITTGSSSDQLYAKGIFVAWGGFDLQRTFVSLSIPPQPAERFDYEINLLMNAPAEFLPRSFLWQEIAQ